MMLLSGSAYPLTVHKNDPIMQVTAVYDIESFSTKGIEKDFTIEYANNVYKLSLKRWSGHPHFSAAYYDENRKMLCLYSMTDRGFKALIERLNSFGYDLYPDPDIRITMAMGITATKVLKREIQLNEYDSLFKKDQPIADKEAIEKLNSFLAMVLPDINAGRKPDIKSIARKAGIDEEMASTILKEVMDKTKFPT
jgi:GH24 family phage-related lysozyme (muramidase)